MNRQRCDNDMHIRDYEPKDEQTPRRCLIQLQEAERLINPRVVDDRLIADQHIAALLSTYDIEEQGKILVAEQDGIVVRYAAILGTDLRNVKWYSRSH